MIERPARLADIEVDPELVARLVRDTDTGEALPLLRRSVPDRAAGRLPGSARCELNLGLTALVIGQRILVSQ